MVTWSEMRSAPAAVAAWTISLSPAETAPASPVVLLPNGPTSTASPAAVKASMPAVTWGPGLPSSKGSMVNSAVTLTWGRLATC
jgi:hypothetical protein